MATFALVQHAIALATYGALLVAFSPLAVALVALAAVPAFLVESRFSGEAFRLFRWRTPETRQQIYLESVIAREDNAKEVMLFGLGRAAARALRGDLPPRSTTTTAASRCGAGSGASRSASCRPPRST